MDELLNFITKCKVEIGSYDPVEAETLTELALDSKELYQAIETLLRGDSSWLRFLLSFQHIVESLHCDYIETQRQIERDAAYEVSCG